MHEAASCLPDMALTEQRCAGGRRPGEHPDLRHDAGDALVVAETVLQREDAAVITEGGQRVLHRLLGVVGLHEQQRQPRRCKLSRVGAAADRNRALLSRALQRDPALADVLRTGGIVIEQPGADAGFREQCRVQAAHRARANHQHVHGLTHPAHPPDRAMRSR